MIGRMVFLTIEKWPSDQSLVVNEILTSENNSMGFFAFVVWGLAKWMKENFSKVCWL